MTVQQEHDTIEKIRLRMQPKMVALFRRALNAQLDLVILGIESSMLNPEQLISETQIRQAFVQLYTSVGRYFAIRTYRQVSILSRKDRANDLRPTWERLMTEFVATKAGDSIRRITNTTKSIVRRVLVQGGQQGWGTDKIARVLRKNWVKLSRSRALTIARTEIITASNQGSIVGAQYVASELGVQVKKEWIATSDSRTRDAHRSVNRQIRNMDEDFTVGGEKLSYPGDPKASAGNRINCRCTVGFIVV